DHHRYRRAQQRALDPGRVEDVTAPRVLRLDDLAAVALPQRLEQAARVAADPTRVLGWAAVECDLHVASLTGPTNRAYVAVRGVVRRAPTLIARPHECRVGDGL